LQRPLGKDELARAIVETVRQPLLLLDESFRVLEANPAFYRHFLESPNGTIGRQIFELGDRQWDLHPLRDLLARVLAENSIEDYEVRHEFPAIGERVVILDARQVSLDDKKQLLLLVAFEDVTERRALEATALSYAQQLEASNRQLEEFAHAAAHDLQEPLRKIRMFSDRFAQSFGSVAMSERQRDYLDRMTRAVARMQQRIDDTLKLARLSRRAPSISLVDLNAVLGRVLDDLGEQISSTGAQIEADEFPVIHANAAQLELVLQNLIANSLRFRKPGITPRIVLRCELVRLNSAEALRITLSDNGVGFPGELAHRLFRPFERLHPRDEFDGTGIGLSIVRRIVESHGGQVSARSRAGEGATFEVTLPLSQEPTHGR
jgi:two-component system, chemotaxis family, CheB/CheR fusion protein